MSQDTDTTPVPAPERPFYDLGWLDSIIRGALALDHRVGEVTTVSAEMDTVVLGVRVGGTDFSVSYNITP